MPWKRPTDERWILRRRKNVAFETQLSDLHPLVSRVLYARKRDTTQLARAFLHVPDALDSDPLTLPDMPEAVARIRQALGAGERIVVYGDFDVDGVCASAMLVSALEKLGADVGGHIPDRFDEGYGLNTDSLLKIHAEGAELLITVDCGIRSYDEVAAAMGAGLDLIVTDHHSVPDTLPPAIAVVDPKRSDSDYPFPELCGTAVAYRLVEALAGRALADEYLDLVGTATIADVVPLVGENRILASMGLRALREGASIGLAALMDVAKVQPALADAESIGFRLGPRINAAGRMEHANLAFELMRANDVGAAAILADHLNELNQKRQRLLEEQISRAAVTEQKDETGPCTIVWDQCFHQGLVGLLAGRICEAAYRPALVITVNEDDCTGSARSIEGFHVTRALEASADLLTRFGGHAAAAGFSLRRANLEAFCERLQAYAAETLSESDLTPRREVDAIVKLAEITQESVRALDVLGPFGEANEKPLFSSLGVEISSIRAIGRKERHLTLTVRQGRTAHRCIAWGKGQLAQRYARGARVDLLYAPFVDSYQGVTRVQLGVRAIRPAKG